MASAGHADGLITGFRARTDPVVGMRVTVPSLPPLMVAAASGLDYLYLDQQHGPITLSDIWTIVATLSGHDLLIFVRVSEPSATEIGAVLDAGAHGVIVPDVSSADQAVELLAATRYPPEGTRSWGAYAFDAAGYGSSATRHERPLFMPMVESASGIDEVEAIASIPGVDGIYVGRYDLALSLGVPATAVSPAGERHEVIERTRAACDAAGIPMATTGAKNALLAEGFRMITLGSELDLLHRGIAAAQER